VNESDEIRQEMARIRHDLHEDVTGVVGGANEAMDWRSYPRAHPWLAGGAAFLVGYLLVPKRSKAAEIVRIPTSVPMQAVSTNPHGAVLPPESQKRSIFSPWRILGWGLSFAGPLALNAAQAYASVWLENQLGFRPKGPDGPEADDLRDRGGRPTKEGRAGMSTTTYGSGRG